MDVVDEAGFSTDCAFFLACISLCRTKKIPTKNSVKISITKTMYRCFCIYLYFSEQSDKCSDKTDSVVELAL